ncbi:MAG: hypothetical protein UX80_C0008G0007 [Candidatus Amesbacteria bacterium GW2011_GWA2_47_11b]|uniref:Uncharacterized protein n=1 Tax=Candidatus Amesbacteria bacterium GW2011_GWA2_47_11b TaxID=1618358 RepID=A0A0G1RKP7_9BACT|nr:MAG: hypothetical protein UX80_C0008G0007 [Candidatus Amesbacteria bacterium GW2011_GWA2_47_11b]
MKIDEYINFLDSWFLEIEKMGIDVAGLPLDHLGYSASSNELKYKDYLISAVELIEPKTGESRKSGYEHAEFTIDFPFEDLVKKYPDLPWDINNVNRPDFPRLKIVLGNGTELKFNHLPILGS